MKVIFTDFNGVLDDSTKISNESSLSFRLPQIADVQIVTNLVKLAKKHNALILSISTFAKYTDMFNVLIRVIKHHTDETELDEYLHSIKRDVINLQNKLSVGKRETILDFINLYPNAKFVSLEDEVQLPVECNQIYIDTYSRLTDKNLIEIDKRLSL